MNPNPTTASSATSSSAASPDVSRRAYELWELNGRPEGCDIEHWLQAEKEIGSKSQQSNGKHSNGQSSAGSSGGAASSPASASKPVDTKPAQGTRGAPAVNRDPKTQRPASPFGDRAPSTSGGQTAGTKRR